MSTRTLFTRSSMALALGLTGALAFVGGISLHGTGIMAVGLTAVVTGCLGAGVARESTSPPSRHATTEAAWRSAVGAVAVLLVLSGAAVLAGGAAPVVVVVWGVVVALAWWARRSGRRAAQPGPRSAADPPAAPPARPTGRPSTHPSARRGTHPSGQGTTDPPPPPGPSPAGWHRAASSDLPELSELSMEALGREWLRTASALEAAAHPAARALVVQRRQEALDELERRDPVGFARWLAAGVGAGSDPAQYLRGDSSAGSGTA